MPGIKPADVDVLTVPDFTHVSQMAITHSDAAIIGSREINPDVDAFLRNSGRPFLEYQDPDNFVEAYSTFYKDVLGV
jgi:starch synthase